MAYPDTFPAEYRSGNEPYRRLRVDNGEPGFFEGRQFFIAQSFSFASASSVTYQFTLAVNTIIRSYRFSVEEGGGLLSVVVGGTGAGTFTPIPILSKNDMTSVGDYAVQNSAAVGGTVSGGVSVPLEEIRTANASGQTNSGTGGDNDLLAWSPRTVYVTITPLDGVTGDTSGILRLVWEERQGDDY